MRMKMKKRFKELLISLWTQLKEKTNLIIFACVLAVVYAPTWLVGLLGIIFQNAGMIAVALAYAVFWAGPFTPFFPIVIAITFTIRKIINKFNDKGE